MKLEIKALGDCMTLINGRAYLQHELLNSGTPVLRIQNLNGGDNWYYSNLSLPEDKYCENGDLLFAWSATFGPYIFNGPKSIYHYHIWKIIPKKILDKGFAFYLLVNITQKVKDEAHGISMLHITKSKMEAMQIPLPPLDTQKKIAAILDAADAYRQKTKTLIEKYDQLAQSLFLDMFGDPVRNPKGWEKVEMGNLMRIVRGGSPRPIDNYLGGTYPWIKISDGTRGNDIYLEETKEHIIKEGLNKTRLLPAGSLIFANCGVSLGFARIITFEGCIHDGWLAFSEIDEKILNRIFILKTLNSITQYFRDTAPDGTQPNLNTSIMKSFEFIVPPISLQNRFAEDLQLIVKQKELAQASLQKAEDLFNSLLQKAFNGELVS